MYNHKSEGVLENNSFERFSFNSVIIPFAILMVYMAWVIGVLGLRSDHVVFTGVYFMAFYGNEKSRKLALGFLFFVIYWLLYDSMRVYPNYMVNAVHIEEPYLIEKSWFGISTAEGILTPNEYFARHNHIVLDIITSLFYLSWVPIPLAYAVYLFFTDKKLFLEFSFSFLLVNIIGIMIYYLYPAAPPWYVDMYGFEEHFDIPGNAAGLSRFDEYFNVSVFEGIYNKNANVFAAIPSMHAAFPVILFYFGWKKKLRIASAFFFVLVIGIWFAAVYSLHHYIIDVILGAACAFAAIGIAEWLFRQPRISEWMRSYELHIS